MTIVVLLLLGAMINIAVAWCLSQWALQQSLPSVSSSATSRPPTDADLDWLGKLGWQPLSRSFERLVNLACYETSATGVVARTFKEEDPVWASLPFSTAQREQGWLFASWLETGWPCSAFEGGAYDNRAVSRTAVPEPTRSRPGPSNAGTAAGAVSQFLNPQPAGSILLNERPGATGTTADGYVPIRPIWPGFLINTVLYAMLLSTLVGGPVRLFRTVRTERRLKRGLCPACAYPIGSSLVCTECGHGIPRKPAHASSSTSGSSEKPGSST